MGIDILGGLNNNSDDSSNMNSSDKSWTNVDAKRLESIEKSNANIEKLMADLVANGANNMSQSAARDAMHDNINNNSNSTYRNSRNSRRNNQSATDKFTDAFSESLLEGFLGSGFRDKIKESMSSLADQMGVSVEDVPNELGKEFGKKAMSMFKGTKLGQAATDKFEVLKNQAMSQAKDAFAQGTARYAATMGAEATQAGTVLSGLTSAAASFGPQLLAVGVALAAVYVAAKILGPALEGAAELAKKSAKAANRYNESREKNLQLAQERLEADVKTIIEEPFNILKEAAQKIYDVWDTNLRTINQTQGYNKADLQSLMGSYAERLRNEGLSSVVSGGDITENLTKVLQSGLSGVAAEEFSYLATVLGAAVPTQDFFGYADTYASLAANAIKQGQSEAAAVEYANKQMKLFASNVLYASRQISGGFTTGLKDAQHLFDQSVQIAQASKTGDPSQIAGVMTAVAAITGSIAPDLATSMTDVIAKAATGGNASELVALRSLAGINASNTEFLRQVAANPQKVFSTLFTNLASMQNMSNDAYMEVAEGLSGIFGISMDAFARIDFNYLAQAISSMNVNDASLAENMKLLASGESTTTAEQLKMQQINKYMIEEGLAYVMDNEAARAIQQHMWDEQRAREIMEATYGVELEGAALEFLEGIKHTVDNVLAFLNPIGWIMKKVTDLGATAIEAVALDKDIKGVLEKGKVGSGNAKELMQLTTRNADLNLAPNLLTMMGGISRYGVVSGLREASSSFWGVNSARQNKNISVGISSALSDVASSFKKTTDIASRYAWGTMGKSTASAITGGLAGATPGGPTASTASHKSATNTAKSAVQAKLDKMLSDDYINKMVSQGKGYDDWAKTAKNFGIADLESAVKDAGYSMTKVQAKFEAQETAYGKEEQSRRYAREEEHWDLTEEYDLQMIDLLTYNNKVLDDIYKKHTEFFDAWVEYFVKHTVYSASYNHTDVSKMQQKERDKSGDAVYALAEALTKNTVDLLDPTVQTNAILSQILIIVNAIMQQNNKAEAGMSLPDTLAGLALGLTGQK